MGSLSELLAKIAHIPQEELRPGLSEKERPTEMSLIHQVLSPEEIQSARERHPNKAKIRHACTPRRRTFDMEFHVPNGGFHKVVASYGSHGLHITDNDRLVTMSDSVEELHDYLLGLTEDKIKAGAS